MTWEGQLVRLRAIEPKDLDAFVAADADVEGARSGWRMFPPRPRSAALQWIESQTNDGDEFRLAVVNRSQDEVVGTINTHTCNPVDGTCSYGITIFPWHRRQGYAAEAIRLTLHYLFRDRRYQKCTVEVLDDNDASLALHKTLGFQIEGRIRRARFVDGGYRDAIILGITADELRDN
jgi:RimJ/RimL family protein N-acetyltransferase